MPKRILITVCCLLVTMLSIMAQEESVNDWSLWISSEEGVCNEQPALSASELADQDYKRIHTNEQNSAKPFIMVSERLIAPISFIVELNHQANTCYQKCGFNFDKEKTCASNAPPFYSHITCSHKGSYMISKSAVKHTSSGLANVAFVIVQCQNHLYSVLPKSSLGFRDQFCKRPEHTPQKLSQHDERLYQSIGDRMQV